MKGTGGPSGLRAHKRAIAIAFAVVLVLTGVAAPNAVANFVYWPNFNGATIGRAGLDGSNLNNGFLTTTDAPGTAEGPSSVAVDSHHIYWTHGTSIDGAIGRAKLDGTGIDPNFIPHSAGLGDPRGIALTATHIYWADRDDNIGRANIDGTQPNPDFVTTTGPCGLAADKSFLYYVSNAFTPSVAIGRVPIGGGAPDDNFITAPNTDDCGIAVDSSHIFWVEAVGPDSVIARAKIDGTGIDHSLIGFSGIAAYGLAVTPQYIFWGSGVTDNSVGRANLDGSSPNEFFIHPSDGPDSTPYMLAAAPSNSFTLGKPKIKKNGTAVLKATVEGPGVLVADAASKGTQAVESKKKKSTVKRVQVTAGKAGTYKLKIKPKGKALKKLNTTGKAKVKVGVTFTPQGVAGVPNLQKKKVKLKRS